jgi:DNA invertase Pin-like site-specific DNA recombinase
MKNKTIRCAIYTRKSTDEGLDQEFNSLDAQRDAAESYIKSQKHEGWEVVPTMYDDGGFSGGNMERPALKKLLLDIESGKVDIVVVYKVDRLSRSLSDFAKMVDIFDGRNVSFVSVTQAFNTTNSMGRLTLNVLLSFAQFEREVTGERIRDKFAASKKKGMWMGGKQPLGYDVIHRKLVINKDEAEIIRFIYDYYDKKREGQPLWKILDELKQKGYKGKTYISQKGRKVEGKDFTLNQIYKILSNPLYNGKMKHKNEVYEGEHESIIDDELWNNIQSKIRKKEFVNNPNKKSEEPRLVGKVYDYLGNRLSPTYSYKYSANGRYKMRYYINREIKTKGNTDSEFRRIRAEYIDNIVVKQILAVIEILYNAISKTKNVQLSAAILKELKTAKSNPIDVLSKLVLYPQNMELNLKLNNECCELPNDVVAELEFVLQSYKAEISIDSARQLIAKINIDAVYKRSAGQMHIITKDGKESKSERDARYSHSNDKTFSFIAKSFYWNKMIEGGVYNSQKEIVSSEKQSSEYVKKAIPQRYLSPKIISEITSGKCKSQIAVEKLIQCRHWAWKKQEEVLL